MRGLPGEVEAVVWSATSMDCLTDPIIRTSVSDMSEASRADEDRSDVLSTGTPEDARLEARADRFELKLSGGDILLEVTLVSSMERLFFLRTK